MFSSRHLPVIFVAAALASGIDVQNADAAEKRALIVSVNDYQLPQWKLRGAVADGKNIEALLIDTMGYRPDQIRRLFDRDATRQAILSNIKSWLIEGTKAGDEVFFYFSGHGYQQADNNGDEDDGLDETLVPVDAMPDQGSGRVLNMIIDDELEALAAQAPDRKLTVVVDSCHSGTVTRGVFPEQEGQRSLPMAPGMSPPSPVTTRAVAEHRREHMVRGVNPNMTVWSAVAPYQKALEEVEAQPISGVFTNRFIRGLRDKKADANGDGVVTAAELQNYLQKESDAYCKSRRSCDAGLTPTLEIPPTRLAMPVINTPTTGGAATAAAPSGGLTAQTSNSPQPVQNAATNLLSNDNLGGVAIDILPRAAVRAGETVRFKVSSRWEGTLVVIDVNADGKLTQIFPNEFSQKNNKVNRIGANQTVTIPDPTYGFEFTASEPFGKGLLIALVLQDPIDVSAQTSAHRDLSPVPAPVDYMARIAERLRQPWTEGATTRMSRWSMTGAAYEIAR